MKIYFYDPDAHQFIGNNSLNEFLRSNTFLNTRNAWILQTYVRLKSFCSTIQPILSSDIPSKGIFVAHSGDIPFSFIPTQNQFWISVIADGCIPPYSNLRVVQNPMQERRVPKSYYLPHWPQPGLIPRWEGRRSLFNHFAFYGDPSNLEQTLLAPDFLSFLSERGIAFDVRESLSQSCLDYSDVDAVIGIRSFSRKGYIRKPPSKLFNAWIAGVIPILGVESSYRHEGSATNYVEAKSLKSLKYQIDLLRSSSLMRQELVSNGRQEISRISIESISSAWEHMILNAALPLASMAFRMTPIQRRLSRALSYIEDKARALQYKKYSLLDNRHNAL
jgi:hypothetical protein